MFLLFADLDEAGQLRFIKRLAQTGGDGLSQFWDELFAPNGLLGTLKSVLDRPHLFRLVAGTVPDRALRVLESELPSSSKDERLAIEGDRRRELMWALEQLLFRIRTSKGALRLIWLLAETENEKWSNNATGVLEECFHPLHSQMPLPLDERISLIRERLASNPAIETKLTAVKAIRGVFKRSRSIHLRRSSSGEPLDSRPSLTWKEVAEYLGNLAQILISLAQEENEASEAALNALPECVAELIFQGLLEEGMQSFRQMIEWAILDRQGLDVSTLAAILSRVRNFLVQQLTKPNFPMDRRSEYERAIAELAELGASLERASFSIRLKRWAGKGSYRVSSEWKQVEEQLRVLAKEAIQIPQLLTQDVIQWLFTASAKQAQAFFHLLGEEDQTFHFRSTIESLAKGWLGSRAFAPYFSGWAKRDLTGAETRLDQLAESQVVCATALLEATSLLQPTPQGLKRVKKAAEQDPEYATERLGRWIDHLSSKDFKELLRIIAGEDLRRTSSAVTLLGSWMYHKKELDTELREFAWRCIEHGPSKSESRSPAWQFDELAAELTEIDPDSGFQKFKQLFMTSSRSLDWEPLDMDGGDRWWKVLRKKDRRLLFQILLDVSHMNETIQQTVSWRLKELLDQQEDADDLLAVVGHEIENARIVARWLVGSKDNFWKIAFLLLNTFPSDQELFDALTAAATDMETMISGPASTFYETRKAEAKKRLEDPSTPAAVRPWLRELIEHLGSEVSTHLVWEYDRDVNDLRRYIHDKDSSQRIWAIGRVLKYGDPKDIKQLLTVEDIEEALPQVDLPDQRRKMYERLLPVWKHGS
ncbi:MAG: hypothetical protein ACREJU_05390 [Nitrospiraceae bacterium]